MSISIEYDANEPPRWFKLKGIKYCLRDSVILNGEESNVYYGLISKIQKDNQIEVQWYYMPHEMVMSKAEKASLHPSEIFITHTTDWIDVETIQMKAPIFHTKGFAPPKIIPDQWLILRRKYDPYKNTIKSIDLEKDELQNVEKLNVSLCSERSSTKNTPSKATPSSRKSSSVQNEVKAAGRRQTRHSTDPEIEIKFNKSCKIASSSEDNLPQEKERTYNKPGKSTYFFLSSEDVAALSADESPKRQKLSPSAKSKSSASRENIQHSKSRKSTATSNRRSTKLTSELESMSLCSENKASCKTPQVEIKKQSIVSKSSTMQTPNQTRSGRKVKPVENFHSLQSSLEMEALMKENLMKQEKERILASNSPKQTPNRTRSGRKIKPVENFISLKSSMAMEALAKSNLLKQKDDQTSSDSDEDQEVSFKENKPPAKSRSAVANVSTPKSNKKKRATHRRCSMESTDSDADYEIMKKKKTLNKNMRTPKASKFLKPAPLDTPCVIPLREAGKAKETSFSVARSRLHVSAVPESLPCREDQFADIYYFLESKLEDKSGGCMYISGVPGTGKTATVRDVLKHINDGDYDYQMIEINGMKLSDPKQLYSLIYRHLEGKKVTPDHGNLLLSEYFGKCEKKSIVLVVDELDLLWTRKQHVMYNLFDWPNRANSKLVVIAIANTMDLPERMLMNKVASRLGLTRMTFQPYSHSQLLEIINSRLEGTVAFAPEACILAARKVAAASGDARRALDICRHAIEVAELAGSDKVTSLHIQRAITDMYQSVKTRAIMNCTLYQKIFLKSVLGVFRRKGVEEAVFKEVYEVFSSLCQFQGLFAPPCGAVLQLCVELGGTRILLVEQGPPSLHTHIRLNCSQDDVVFALKEAG